MINVSHSEKWELRAIMRNNVLALCKENAKEVFSDLPL